MIGGESKCPHCGTRLKIRIPDLTSPFGCPRCASQLTILSSYSRLLGWISLLISAFLAYGLGFRSYGLVLAGIFIWVPISLFVFFGARRLAPPTAIPYFPEDRSTGILHLDSKDQEQGRRSG